MPEIVLQDDYVDRLKIAWNTDPYEAIASLQYATEHGFNAPSLLLVDWRTEDAEERAAVFVGYLGIGINQWGKPDHGDTEPILHTTDKLKHFVDYRSPIGANGLFTLRERRVHLPIEGFVVASYFGLEGGTDD